MRYGWPGLGEEKRAQGSFIMNWEGCGGMIHFCEYFFCVVWGEGG